MDTKALIKLWNLTQKHPGTSGAEVAVSVLLGLYNGPRFPFDLTELRRLDDDNLKAAIAVISDDAERTVREIHQWLNMLTGRVDFGERFEHLAYEYELKGRCKRNQLQKIDPPAILITDVATDVTPADFKRERRYVIIKMSDIEKHLSESDASTLYDLESKVNIARCQENRGLLNAVVVERDWPEYEPTWAAIEERMKV